MILKIVIITLDGCKSVDDDSNDNGIDNDDDYNVHLYSIFDRNDIDNE